MGRGIIETDIEAFEDLFWMSAIRGKQSTGLMTYTPQGQFKKPPVRTAKIVGPSSYFLSLDSNKKVEERMIRTVFTEVFLGHCRWATVGSVNLQNAHPFDTGMMISAHNGTLTDKKYDDSEKTDSQMMFEDIEKRGLVPVLEDLNKSSAYALSIFNKRDKNVILTRNYERTLFVGISPERGVLFWSSEEEFLWTISSRRKLKLEIFRLEPFVIYDIDLDNVKRGNVTPWTTTEIKNPHDKVFTTWTPRTQTKTTWESEWCGLCGTELFGPTLENARCERPGTAWPVYTCNECVVQTKNNGENQRKITASKERSFEEQEVRVG